MPYIQTAEKFNTDFNMQLDTESIVAAVGSIMTTYSDNKTRELTIKKYIKTSFPDFAAEHEYNRQKEAISQNGISVPTDSKDLLIRYIGLVGEIVKDVSEIKANEMKQAQIDAKADAKAAIDKAKKAQAEAETARTNKAYDAKQKINEANDLVKRANLRSERANDDEAFRFEPWVPTTQDFGLTSEELKTMMIEQVKGANYSEIRREQMRSLGVKNPLFMQGISALDGVKYAGATPEALEHMRNVYVTREFMQARLNRHNFLWKWIFRSETKAMENYVKAADEALKLAGFPDNEKTVAMDVAEKGIRSEGSEINSALDELKVQFRENDEKAIERKRIAKEQKAMLKKEEEDRAKKEQELKDEKQKKNSKIKEIKASLKDKKPEIQKEATALLSTKTAPDTFFEIRFRPTLDATLSKSENDECAKIGIDYNIAKNENLPEGLKIVFEANYKKIRAAREFVKSLPELMNKPEVMKQKMEALEESFMVYEELAKLELAEANIDYKPVTLDQLKLNQELKRTFANDDKEQKQEPPVSQEAIKKDEIVINS